MTMTRRDAVKTLGLVTLGIVVCNKPIVKPKMEVIVNDDLCTMCEKCIYLCPDIFGIGRAETGDDTIIVKVKEVPERYINCVQQAIRLCPAKAIHWRSK